MTISTLSSKNSNLYYMFSFSDIIFDAPSFTQYPNISKFYKWINLKTCKLPIHNFLFLGGEGYFIILILNGSFLLLFKVLGSKGLLELWPVQFCFLIAALQIMELEGRKFIQSLPKSPYFLFWIHHHIFCSVYLIHKK